MVLHQTSSCYHFYKTKYFLSVRKKKGGGGKKYCILTRKITSLFSKHLSHYCHLKQAKSVAGLFSSFVFKAYSKFYFIKVMKTNRKFVVQKVGSGL